MSTFYVAVGQQVTFAKTVSESDVHQFAGITGDLSPNHVNDELTSVETHILKCVPNSQVHLTTIVGAFDVL